MHSNTKKIKSMIILLLVFSFVLAFSKGFTAKAEAKTIVVPDDYQTITDAIGNATEGDTIFVKKGIYEGPINQTLAINKTLSLIGEDAKNTYPYFTYPHSTKTIKIIGTTAIPEFPSWAPMLIVLFGVTVLAVFYKRKLHRNKRGRMS